MSREVWGPVIQPHAASLAQLTGALPSSPPLSRFQAKKKAHDHVLLCLCRSISRQKRAHSREERFLLS